MSAWPVVPPPTVRPPLRPTAGGRHVAHDVDVAVGGELYVLLLPGDLERLQHHDRCGQRHRSDVDTRRGGTDLDGKLPRSVAEGEDADAIASWLESVKSEGAVDVCGGLDCRGGHLGRADWSFGGGVDDVATDFAARGGNALRRGRGGDHEEYQCRERDKPGRHGLQK